MLNIDEMKIKNPLNKYLTLERIKIENTQQAKRDLPWNLSKNRILIEELLKLMSYRLLETSLLTNTVRTNPTKFTW